MRILRWKSNLNIGPTGSFECLEAQTDHLTSCVVRMPTRHRAHVAKISWGEGKELWVYKGNRVDEHRLSVGVDACCRRAFWELLLQRYHWSIRLLRVFLDDFLGRAWQFDLHKVRCSHQQRRHHPMMLHILYYYWYLSDDTYL